MKTFASLLSLTLVLTICAGLSTDLRGQDAPPAAAEAKLSPEITAELQGAADQFSKGDFNGALERLKEICAKESLLSPPRVMMARWFAQAQQGDAFRALMDRATVESPTDPEAYLTLGEIALRQREFAAAGLFLERSEQLLQAYNANAERRKQMIIALLRNQANLAEVREDWRLMENRIDARMSVEGKTPDLLRQKAVAVFRQQRDEESHKLLGEADSLTTNPENIVLPADAVMAQLYNARGDQERGKAFLAQALKKYPKSRGVLTLSAQQRLFDDDLAGARQLAEQLAAEDPAAAGPKRQVANIALFQEDYATAEKLLQEVLVAFPADIEATNGLALALCEQNDPVKLRRAVEYAAENVRRNNRNSEILATLGWVLFKANDFPQAAKVLQQAAAVTQGTITTQTAYYLAELNNKNGNAEQAKQILEALLKDKRPFAKKRQAQALLDELSKPKS